VITHIVMWNLAGDNAESASIVQEQFESMRSRIPQIESLTVVLNSKSMYSNRDLALVTRHRSMKALRNYQVHPVHREVSRIVSPHLQNRACMDVDVSELFLFPAD
jgi:hypothetical protein